MDHGLQSTALDISREGVTWEKVAQLGRLFAPDNNQAVAKVDKFKNIDIVRLNELLKTNFKGVILDVDECVAPHHGEVLDENVNAIIKMISQGIKIVIFSNMKMSERYAPLIAKVKEATGFEIQIITSNHAKPDPRGFEESVAALNLDEGEDVLMIGDNFLTDGGAIRAGIPFIKVKPISTEGEGLGSVKRWPQKVIRAFYAGVSNMYDFVGQRRVLKDRDFSESAH